MELRRLRYPSRLAEVPGSQELRHDRRWISTFSWTRELEADDTEWRLEYELERRASNEVDKAYTAHRFVWTIAWLAGR